MKPPRTFIGPFKVVWPVTSNLSALMTIFPPVTLESEAASWASLALVIELSAGVTLLSPAPSPVKLAAVSLPVTVKSPPILAAPLVVRVPWTLSGPLNFPSPATFKSPPICATPAYSESTLNVTMVR